MSILLHNQYSYSRRYYWISHYTDNNCIRTCTVRGRKIAQLGDGAKNVQKYKTVCDKPIAQLLPRPLIVPKYNNNYGSAISGVKGTVRGRKRQLNKFYCLAKKGSFDCLFCVLNQIEGKLYTVALKMYVLNLRICIDK